MPTLAGLTRSAMPAAINMVRWRDCTGKNKAAHRRLLVGLF
ncbi:hypothetical protein AAM37_gp85 [Pantoea phage vB_PagM_AAM37]|uniref:Uncharacterized protein n=1 Tax=Pantoea phage vB_PagM_AAM37 TaxID=2588093 RepID=A0A513ZYH3_9CAUD|nr:hypothetical protein HWC22_gp85 [Pantoea phage vB_PagM_AAM37]QDH45755.1 hypothetical protein AAM37_gp85 [Pantoea phage vB_PagM_AAM37]